MKLETHQMLARREARAYLFKAIEACEDAGFTDDELAPLVATMEHIVRLDSAARNAAGITRFTTSA